METHGKTFGKRVACDNQKAKKLPTKPIALEEVGKWRVSGLCFMFPGCIQIDIRKHEMSSCNNRQVCKHK